MTDWADLTGAAQRTLLALRDGEWHRGSRSSGDGAVLGGPASTLVLLELAEREGASRTARPSNPGFRYRITEAGRAVIDAEALRWAGL